MAGQGAVRGGRTVEPAGLVLLPEPPEEPVCTCLDGMVSVKMRDTEWMVWYSQIKIPLRDRAASILACRVHGPKLWKVTRLRLWVLRWMASVG